MIIPQKPTSPLMSATVNETSSAQVELIGKEMEAHGRSIQSTTDVFPTPSTIAAPTPIETDALSAKTIAAWIAGDLSYEVANDTAKAVAVSLSSTECIAQVPRTLEWIVSTGARVAVVFGLRELEDPCARLLLRYLSDKGMLQDAAVIVIDPLDQPDAQTQHCRETGTQLLAQFGVTAQTYTPLGVRTAKEFWDKYGFDMRYQDPELYAHVVFVEPLRRAMCELKCQLRVSARHKKQYGQGQPLASPVVSVEYDAWVRCDPLANLSIDDLVGAPSESDAGEATNDATHLTDMNDDAERQVASAPGTEQGVMMLVGAGPGDPGLLTCAARQAIETADVVIADRLVSKAILNLARGTIMVADKRPGRSTAAQNELDSAGLEALKAGRSVVRLKGGDPFVFGRGGEEVMFYGKHGFRVGVIPAVSSSVAAAACAGIPLTMRGVSDRFMVLTAALKDGTIPDLPTYTATCTYVFLMGVARLRLLAEILITKHGFPESTPVAMVQSGSCPEQRLVTADLSSCGDVAEKEKIKAPAAVVLGNVVHSLPPAFMIPYAPLLTL